MKGNSKASRAVVLHHPAYLGQRTGRQFTVAVEEKQDGLVIHGGKLTEPQGEIRIDAYGDHRIVMSAAVGAALLGREAVIEGAEAVAKSYPAFFAEFIRLGGGADVL